MNAKLSKNNLLKLIRLSLLSLIATPVMAQTDTVLLKRLLASKPELFASILNHPQQHEVQIMYTQVDRDQKQQPSFKTFSYRLDNQHYFYPASTVKLAAVVFALEKINDNQYPNSIKSSAMHTDSAFRGQTKVVKDPSAQNGKPSILHYIKKILLTSDNDAFNRLYEFIGRAALNAKLKKHGMSHSRIINRLAIGDGGEQAKHTNPITFWDKKPILQIPAQYDPLEYPLTLTNLLVGKGYLNNQDELVHEPFNFDQKNVFTIADQQLLMRKLMLPEAFPKSERFNLKAADYRFIYQYMSMYPTESEDPTYDPKTYWPTYAKMLYYGREKNVELDPNIRIFNKYGDSYGFIIDNAYFIDRKNGVEFFLTAVVQSNEDGIYNDNKYEYETVCYPFMKNLGRVIYDFELNRGKNYLPDFKRLNRITYVRKNK